MLCFPSLKSVIVNCSNVVSNISIAVWLKIILWLSCIILFFLAPLPNEILVFPLNVLHQHSYICLIFIILSILCKSIWEFKILIEFLHTKFNIGVGLALLELSTITAFYFKLSPSFFFVLSSAWHFKPIIKIFTSVFVFATISSILSYLLYISILIRNTLISYFK